MIPKNFKILALIAVVLISLGSCKDQEKIDAENKAMEDKIAMEEAVMDAEAAKTKEETKKKEMMATSIASVAGRNEELSTLISAIKAAELDKMLSEPGNYTVFAPSNNAFTKLPKNLSIAELGKPENKELLTNVLKYHVVSGQITTDKLVEAINGAQGRYSFTTVAGKEITASIKNDQIILRDEKGNRTQVVLGNVKASNGVIHVINDVLLTK